MEQEICLKHNQFEEEVQNFIQKYFLCRRIVSKLTNAVLKENARDEAKIQGDGDLKVFFETVNTNLDIFTAFFKHCNSKADVYFDQLIPIENGHTLSLFTYKQCDLKQYKTNRIGQCVITRVLDRLEGRCIINDLKKPRPQLLDVCKENLTKFPLSGEIFAVDLGEQGLYRAVRNDLQFKPRPRIIVYLLDIGKRLEIPCNLQKFYSLPVEYRDMEPCAIPCKVVKLIGQNGLPLDVETNLQDSLNESAYFEIKKVEDNTLWIKLCLNEEEDHVDEFTSNTSFLLSNVVPSHYTEDNVETESNEMLSTNYDYNETFLNDSDVSTRMEIAEPEFAFDQSSHDNERTEMVDNEVLDTVDESYLDDMEIPDDMEIAEFQYTCDICDFAFDTKIEIETHMKLHILKSETENHSNISRSHKGKKTYTCEICEVGFSHHATLVCHSQTHKKTCRFCHKGFSEITDLKHHVKCHKGKQAIICETCGKMFATHQSLKCHMNLHTKQNPFPCRICDKIFFNQISLDDHLKTRHGEKHCCGVCGKSFTLLRNLKQHSKIHTGEKAYVCKICDKGFTRNTSLRLHLIIHTNGT